MRRFRFILISLVSFIAITIGTILIPGSFLNRLVLVSSCGILSLNSTFCTPNLGLPSDRAMAFDSFNTKDQGHRGITLEALKGDVLEQGGTVWDLTGYWVSPTDGKKPIKDPVTGENLNFTKAAQQEIERAVRHVDLNDYYLNEENVRSIISHGIGSNLNYSTNGPEKLFSPDFDKPYKHFDRETFSLGSVWLIALKKEIKSTLDLIIDKNATENQKQGAIARSLIGQALHTLQDFYAHSNWVELGEAGITQGINQDLGKALLCEMPRNSEVEEIKKEKLKYVNFDVLIKDIKLSLITPPCSKRPDKEKNGDPGDPTALWTDICVPTQGICFKGYDQSKLDPNLRKLTSGYFMGLTDCSAPQGKVRHGIDKLCSDGLNKDNNKRPHYAKAANLAEQASRNYIHQIIDELAKEGNFKAIKALMGMSSTSAFQPGLQLVALDGDVVDGHKISISNPLISGQGQIDEKGNVVYLAEIEQGQKALFHNNKLIYYSGQTLGDSTVNIGDFFLFRDGSLDVLLFTEKGPIITHNGANLFESSSIEHFIGGNRQFTKYSNNGIVVRYSDNQHSYYYGYSDDQGYHILKNGSEEVPNLPTSSAKSTSSSKSECNDGEGITRVINNKHQSVCIGRMNTTSQAILVRDDGKIFPSVGGPQAMNNNGKVLTYGKIFPLNSQKPIPFGIGLLDYARDAFDSNHIFTKRDYDSHLLRIPYGKLVKGKLSDTDNRKLFIRDASLVIGDYSTAPGSGPSLLGSDLTDNGNLLLLVDYGKSMIIKWVSNSFGT